MSRSGGFEKLRAEKHPTVATIALSPLATSHYASPAVSLSLRRAFEHVRPRGKKVVFAFL